METWYRTSSKDEEIVSIEVDTGTASALYLLDGSRIWKHTRWFDYWPSFAEAKRYLLIRTQDTIDDLTARIKVEQGRLAKIVERYGTKTLSLKDSLNGLKPTEGLTNVQLTYSGPALRPKNFLK